MLNRFVKFGLLFAVFWLNHQWAFALSGRQKVLVGYGLGAVIGAVIVPFNWLHVAALSGTFGTAAALTIGTAGAQGSSSGFDLKLDSRKVVDEGFGRLQLPNAPTKKVKWRLYEGQVWVPATDNQYYFVDKILEFEKY